MASIVVSWTDNSSNETGFRIYSSTDGVTFTNLHGTVGAGVQTYEASGLTIGQNYWFRVVAYNNDGESAYIQAGPLKCVSTSLTRMSFNPRRNEIFIAPMNGTTYILGEKGLSAISADIQDMVDYKGALLIHAPSAISQASLTFSTNVLTFGSTCQKNIWGIGADIICPGNVNITISYRKNRTDSWTTTTTKVFNTAQSYLNANRLGGVEFKINFSVSNYTIFALRNLFVRYSNIDGNFLAQGA